MNMFIISDNRKTIRHVTEIERFQLSRRFPPSVVAKHVQLIGKYSHLIRR